MRKLEKVGRTRHSYKLASGGNDGGEKIKDTVLTLEIAGASKTDKNNDGATESLADNEFTGGAHLR